MSFSVTTNSHIIRENENDYINEGQFLSYQEGIKHLSLLGLDQRISVYFQGYQQIQNGASPTETGTPSLLYIGLNKDKKVIYIVVKNERNKFASLIQYDINSNRLQRICDCMRPILKMGQMHSYLCNHSILDRQFATHANSSIGCIQFRTYDHNTLELEIEDTVKTNWKDGSLVLTVYDPQNGHRINPFTEEHYRHIKDEDKPLIDFEEYQSPVRIASSNLTTIDPDDIYLSRIKNGKVLN